MSTPLAGVGIVGILISPLLVDAPASHTDSLVVPPACPPRSARNKIRTVLENETRTVLSQGLRETKPGPLPVKVCSKPNQDRSQSSTATPCDENRRPRLTNPRTDVYPSCTSPGRHHPLRLRPIASKTACATRMEEQRMGDRSESFDHLIGALGCST